MQCCGKRKRGFKYVFKCRCFINRFCYLLLACGNICGDVFEVHIALWLIGFLLFPAAKYSWSWPSTGCSMALVTEATCATDTRGRPWADAGPQETRCGFSPLGPHFPLRDPPAHSPESTKCHSCFPCLSHYEVSWVVFHLLAAFLQFYAVHLWWEGASLVVP